MNSVGVKIEPCGPPREMENHLDFSSLISTKALRFISHTSIQLRKDLGIHNLFSFPRHPSTHNWSKAILKSTEIIATGELLDIIDKTYSMNSNTLVCKRKFSLNPDGVCGKRPLFLRILRNRGKKSFSSIFKNISNNKIGLVNDGGNIASFLESRSILTSFQVDRR
jgi:hypothetical protein